MNAKRLIIGMVAVCSIAASADSATELGADMRRRLNDGVTATKNFWNGLTSDQNIGQNRPTVQTDEQRREEERRIEAARKAQEERARTLQISSPVEITIGYGTEKAKLMNMAKAEFQKKYPNVTVNLVGVGSLEGMNAVLKGGAYQKEENGVTKNYQLTVWSPASSLLQNYVTESVSPRIFANLDQNGHAQSIVQSPMVFMMSSLAYDCLDGVSKKADLPGRTEAFGGLTFRMFNYIKDQEAKSTQSFGSLAAAWLSKPACKNLGALKVAFTDPLKSNSGFLATTIIGMEAYDEMKIEGKSTIDEDIAQKPVFKELLKNSLERFNTDEDSTGNLAKIVNEKPLQFTLVVSYENLAMETYRNAKAAGRTIRIVYPQYNVMNDHPYYILNNPGVITAEQQKAAKLFSDFLLSKAAQTYAVTDLFFRPADSTVSLVDNNFGSVPVASTQPGMRSYMKIDDIVLSTDDMISNKGVLFIDSPSLAALSDLIDTITKIRRDQGKLPQ